MKNRPEDLKTLHQDQRGSMNADRFSGPHKEAAKAYFLQCIDAATYEAKHMVIAELVDRIEVKKDYEITIYWRMTADQFLGKKTEASA